MQGAFGSMTPSPCRQAPVGLAVSDLHKVVPKWCCCTGPRPTRVAKTIALLLCGFETPKTNDRSGIWLTVCNPLNVTGNKGTTAPICSQGFLHDRLVPSLDFSSSFPYLSLCICPFPPSFSSSTSFQLFVFYSGSFYFIYIADTINTKLHQVLLLYLAALKRTHSRKLLLACPPHPPLSFGSPYARHVTWLFDCSPTETAFSNKLGTKLFWLFLSFFLQSKISYCKFLHQEQSRQYKKNVVQYRDPKGSQDFHL